MNTIRSITMVSAILAGFLSTSLFASARDASQDCGNQVGPISTQDFGSEPFVSTFVDDSWENIVGASATVTIQR